MFIRFISTKFSISFDIKSISYSICKFSAFVGKFSKFPKLLLWFIVCIIVSSNKTDLEAMSLNRSERSKLNFFVMPFTKSKFLLKGILLLLFERLDLLSFASEEIRRGIIPLDFKKLIRFDFIEECDLSLDFTNFMLITSMIRIANRLGN